MHRTRGANYALVGAQRRYTDGPPATTVPAVDFNAAQEEIAHVIEQAGITLLEPENDTFDQLYQAISALITGVDLTGYVNRGRFAYKDADEIYLYPGVYQLIGTSTKTIKWDSTISFQIGPGGSNADSDAIANDTWYYIYIDDSAIVISGHTILTASDFVAKTTVPSYAAAKHGWYNGNDRCIFAIKTDGAGNIEIFYHDGTYVEYDVQTANSIGDIDNVWTDVTLDIPNFGDNAHAIVTFRDTNNGVDSGLLSYRKNGSTGAGNPVLDDVGSDQAYNTRRVVVDSSQKIECCFAGAGDSLLLVYTVGYILPFGM